MKRSEELQLGITNFINDRLKVHIHRLEGWTLIKIYVLIREEV